MEIDLPVLPGLALRIDEYVDSKGDYPTSRLQKGLLLVYNGEELAEEAVGFGVPVLRRGLQTIFPGGVELLSLRRGPVLEVTAIFRMCLEEKISSPELGSLNNKSLYTIKNALAALIRGFPILRGVLTAASGGLRRMFGWETIYEDAGAHTKVKMIYTVYGEAGRIDVEVDATGLAFCLITRRAFETIAGTPMPSFDERASTRPPSFFGWNNILGEDLQFCQDAKKHGLKIWVDTRIEIGHVSEFTVDKTWFWREVATREPDIEEKRLTMNAKMGLPTLTAAEAKEKLGWS